MLSELLYAGSGRHASTPDLSMKVPGELAPLTPDLSMKSQGISWLTVAHQKTRRNPSFRNMKVYRTYVWILATSNTKNHLYINEFARIMFQLYLLQLLVAVLAENGQSEPCDKGSGLPKSLNHQETRSVRVIWEEPKSPQQALMVKWKKRTRWIPRRSLTLKTKLRLQTGFSGIRVGEATHPGPAEIFLAGNPAVKRK